MLLLFSLKWNLGADTESYLSVILKLIAVFELATVLQISQQNGVLQQGFEQDDGRQAVLSESFRVCGSLLEMMSVSSW